VALGWPHPDYLLPYLTSSQLSEWEAYRRIKPFGQEMDDHRMAMICAAVANFSGNVDRKRKPQGLKVADFLPEPKKSKRQIIAKAKLAQMIAEA
jgi:hypothetical protein